MIFFYLLISKKTFVNLKLAFSFVPFICLLIQLFVCEVVHMFSHLFFCVFLNLFVFVPLFFICLFVC